MTDLDGVDQIHRYKYRSRTAWEKSRPSPAVVPMVLVVLFALAGCGGGGGGAGNGSNNNSSSTAAPAASMLTLGFGVKQLQFTWTAVGGATHYRLFENPDGASGFTQVGGDLTTINAMLDIAVHRHDWANARYLVEACNDVGCTASNEVSTLGAVLQAIGYFKASNTNARDRFGSAFAVALSGDGRTLAVGAPNESSAATGIGGNEADNSAANSGAVYVFARIGSGAWAQQAYIKASNTEAGDAFGSAVALSGDGDTLAVGARLEDSASTGIGGSEVENCNPVLPINCAENAGAVYVYTRAGNVWTQQAYLKASNADAFDGFGSTLALSRSGNTLAVGAWQEDSAATGVNGNQADNSTINSGAAYVFVRNLGAWAQDAYIKPSNTEAGDEFGAALAVSGDGATLSVGAPNEDSVATGIGGNQADNSARGSGAVYVFLRFGTWSQQAYLKASNTDAGDRFGGVLALSNDGNTLAIGAQTEDSTATGVGGNQADNSALGSGAAYVFVRENAFIWSQQAYLKASNTGSEDRFGAALALSGDGDTLAVGANGEDSGATGIDGDQTGSVFFSGAAYVFNRNTGAWTQDAYVKAANTGIGDAFGYALALDDDGDTLAVSAVSEASAASGFGGDQTNDTAPQSGAVYLY